MSPKTRMLLLLLALALGGISALALMAQRYARIVERRGGAELARQAEQRVAAFVAVRQSMGQAVRGTVAAESAGAALERARTRALAVHRLSLESYRELREQYRVWRAGGPLPTTPTTRALEHRRAELAACDLGPYERLEP